MSADGKDSRPQKDGVSPTTSERESVFISYSLEDVRFRKMLMRHLRVLENQRLIRTFFHQALPPGALWQEITQQEISGAAVAILLVTPDYLGSRALMEDQLPRLLDSAKKAGTTIMPLLVKPSLFYSLPHLYSTFEV